MYKMVIADDEVLVCKYLRYVVKEKHLPFDICGEAKNGNDALQLVEKYNPTFVILDVNMPILNGLETAKIIPSANVTFFMVMSFIFVSFFLVSPLLYPSPRKFIF